MVCELNLSDFCVTLGQKEVSIHPKQLRLLAHSMLKSISAARRQNGLTIL